MKKIILCFISAILAVGAIYIQQQDEPILAKFYCGNHTPSHYASDGTKIADLTEKYGCTNWKSVTVGSLSGSIVSNGEPAIGATITMMDGDGLLLGGATTNAEGFFLLSGVPKEGSYLFNASMVGFSTQSITVNLEDLDNETLTINLDE